MNENQIVELLRRIHTDVGDLKSAMDEVNHRLSLLEQRMGQGQPPSVDNRAGDADQNRRGSRWRRWGWNG